MSPISLPSSPRTVIGSVPDLFAGVAVQADQVGVERRHVEPVAPGGEPPVDGVAAERQVLGQRLLVVPELGAGLAIDGVGMVPGRRQVHDAVDDQRRALEAVEHSRLEGPDRNQSGDVLGVDLLQRTVAMSVVGAAVHQPVAIVGPGLQEVVVIDVPDRFGRRLLSRGRRLEGTQPPRSQHQPGDKPQHRDQTDRACTWSNENMKETVSCAHGGYLASLQKSLRQSEECAVERLAASSKELRIQRSRQENHRPTQPTAIILVPYAQSSISIRSPIERRWLWQPAGGDVTVVR